jgi:hypothetical protein
MTRPTISIHNTETGEIIVREYNDAEFAAYEAQQAALEIAQAEAEAKAQAKAELLERLGITADEAKLLLA